MTSKGIPLGANFCSNCDFIKRTCGPNNRTSTGFDSKCWSASEAETAKYLRPFLLLQLLLHFCYQQTSTHASRTYEHNRFFAIIVTPF